MMKSSVLIPSFLCTLLLFCSCTKHLEYASNEGIEEKVVGDKFELQVSVNESGILKNALAVYDYRSIYKLSLAGPVNGTDLKFIRLMAGADEYGNKTDGSLEILDLSAATIVEGGEPYFIYIDEDDKTETPIVLHKNELSSYAFGYCNLKEIILPEGITNIASQAFFSCENLKSINIPTSLSHIGMSAFCYCESLKSKLVIPEGITEIPDYTFYGCKQLTSVILPDSVLSLGYESFSGCTGIVNLGNLPNLKNFDECCFANCRSLQSFRIPFSMTTIPDYAFSGCWSLSSIDLSNVDAIGNNAFYGCYKLTSFTLSDKLQHIGHYAFASSGLNMDLVLPKTVKYIGYEAFFGTDITSVTINSDIRTYEDELTNPCSFGYCKNLKSVRVAEGCKFLGMSFSNCTALESVTLPSSLDSLGYVFDKREYYLVGREVPQIDYIDIGDIFRNCISLKTITLPSNLKYISSYCFLGCSSLEKIDMPDALKYLGTAVFSGCSSLSNIKLSESIDCLPYGCFQDCPSLVDIVIPDNVKEIEGNCFENSGLQSITMSNSLEFIGISSFSGCANLESITIPSSVKSILGSAFNDCSMLKSVSFESKGALKTIENFVFYHCPMLEHIVLPEGVTSVGSCCFSLCGLKEVSIPSTVQTLGEGCFDRCLKLCDFRNYSETPQIIETDIFANIKLDDITLYVPSASIDVYKCNSYWGKFPQIVGLQ